MKTLRKISDTVYKAIMYSVSAVLAIMVLVAFVEVIRRYLFGKTFLWSDDLIRYLIIYVGFVGGAAAFRDDNLASLDLVTRHFPQKLQTVLELLVNTIVLAIVVFLMHYSFGAIESPGIKYSVGTVLRIAMWIPYLALPIGFSAMIFFAIEKYIKLFTKLWKGGAE